MLGREEAGQTSGVGWWKRYRRVLLPLLSLLVLDYSTNREIENGAW